MLVCITVLYQYMKSLKNYVHTLCGNTHVRIKIYRKFYHCITYIANEEHHVIFIECAIILFYSCLFSRKMPVPPMKIRFEVDVKMMYF